MSLNRLRLAGFPLSDWFFLGAVVFSLLEMAVITSQKYYTICWFRNRLLWIGLLVTISGLLSTTRSTFINVALAEVGQIFFIMTFFVSQCWVMVRRGRMKDVVVAFIVSGFFTSLVSLVDKISGSNYGLILSGTPDLNLEGRFAGTLWHPNKFGYFLVLTSLLTIGLMFDKVFSSFKEGLTHNLGRRFGSCCTIIWYLSK